VTAPKFERARSAEAKLIRETAILDAATRQATERGVRSVTLTDIAAEVGMHKSAMLRYFETREEIFLRLAGGEWVSWSHDVREQLHHLAEPTIPAIAATLADSLVARPLFCDLLGHTPLSLERGVSFDAVKSFKVSTIAEVEAIAGALRESLPLTATQAGDAIATATAMAGALWQMAAPGTELRRFYQQTPELAHALVDVAPRLTNILTALLRGYC
jgi:AcrR family transcriptional regulator